MNKSRIIKTGKTVLNIEANAISKLSKGLGNEFYKAVSLIISLKGN